MSVETYTNGVIRIPFVRDQACERDFRGEYALWLSGLDLTPVQVFSVNLALNSYISSGGMEFILHPIHLKVYFPEQSYAQLNNEILELLDKGFIRLNKETGVFFFGIDDETLRTFTPHHERRSSSTLSEPDTSPCTLYVLFNGFHYKVGIAASLERRVAQLQTASSLKLITVNTFNGPRHEMARAERNVHVDLAKFNTVSEWFDCSEDVVLSAVREAVLASSS